MKKEKKHLEVWETCEICQELPASLTYDFLNPEANLPPNIYKLDSIVKSELSEGYRKWTAHCPLCKTAYEVEVDVEPMVWDLYMKRLEEKE